MKVSVIIPVHSTEKYLKECFESVLNQSLDEIEIVCVSYSEISLNVDIINLYSKKYKNFKVINIEDKSFDNLINIAIEGCSGEYIYMLDPCECIEKYCLEIYYKEAKKNDLDIAIFEEKSLDVKGLKTFIHSVVTGEELFTLSSWIDGYKTKLSLNLYKTKFIKENSLCFREDTRYYHRVYAFNLLLLAQRVKCIQYKLCKKAYMNSSIINSNTKKETIKEYIYICKVMHDKYLQLKHEGKYELSRNIIENIKIYLSKAVLYCDELREFELKNNIIKFIKNKTELLDIKLEIMISNPAINYNTKLLKASRREEFYLYRNMKKIFYMLTPTHGNLGDQAIAYATQELLSKLYPKHKIIEINYQDVYLYTNVISQIANEQDLVILHGGGNMGNHYIWEEEARRYIIATLHNLPIISFPQTIYFSDDDEGFRQLQITKNIYNNHKNLTLIAREKTSFNIMKDSFINCNVIMCPDIVFSLNENINKDNDYNRKYVITYFRKDKESYYDIDKKSELVTYLSGKYDFIESDTVVDYDINEIDRELELKKLWTYFKKSKVIITDRLHGMIFAAITKTPCIVLRSLDYKVIESYKWISDLNYIKITDNLSFENIERLIKELLELKEVDRFDLYEKHSNEIKIEIDNSIKRNTKELNNSNKKIEVKEITINDNEIVCSFTISKNLNNYFNYTNMSLKYSKNIENIPQSIAIIPLLSNILPIAWFTGSNIIVDEIDYTFYESAKNMKKAFENMYNINLHGDIIYSKLIKNNDSMSNDCITLFSGGVDSLSTVVNNINKNPILATIWGSDVDINNHQGWSNAKKAVMDIGNKFELENIFIKSDFRKYINEHNLNSLLATKETSAKCWWTNIQHGMALISHLAPFAYKYKIGNVYIPGTLDEKYIKQVGKSYIASDPTIDNEFKFASCVTTHEGFKFSRQEKIENISKYRNTVEYDFDTRVCFSSHDGQNCNMCKKCSITILGLIQQKQNPNNYGFRVNEKLLYNMKLKFEQEFIFDKFALKWWDNMKDLFLKEEEFWRQTPFISWIMDIDTSEEFNKMKLSEFNKRR